MRKTSVIPSGVTLEGDIEGDADLVVYGRVEGPIHVGGTLVIEGSGVVRGHVRASAVIVRGVLKGNAFGDELVRVDEGARLVGELTAPRVQVVPGAHFRGQIHVATVGEPRLTSYDPTLHTFSGWPSPEPFGAVAPSPVGSGMSERPIAADAPPTFDDSFAPVGSPRVGDAADVTLFEASAPELTHVVEPPAAATPAAHAPAAHAPAAHAPAATPAKTVVHAPAEPVPSSQTHVSAFRDPSESLDVDATLSEATTFPPPPQRLPLRMPRLGGRTPGTRRWT